MISEISYAFQKLEKETTTSYLKQIQQTLKNCPDILDKHRIKCLIPNNSTLPKHTACLKTHKPSIPIRPEVNNINLPTYKTAKFLIKTLNNFIKLPNMYNCVNSDSLAQNLVKQVTHGNCNFITFDINDLFVNIPIKETLHIPKYFVILMYIIATL
jgi:hypothetical protein